MPRQGPPVILDLEISQRDIDRVNKRLDKWKDKPLAVRLEKAIQGAASLLVNPIRGNTPVVTGNLRRSVRVTKLRKQSGEIAAYKVGPTARHKHLIIRGTSRGVEANPFVDRAVNPLEGKVRDFAGDQVRNF